MYIRPNQFLEFQDCYYPFQFGFCLNFSTNNALMSIVANVQTQLHNGHFVLAFL